jgi:hypothetical protein
MTDAGGGGRVIGIDTVLFVRSISEAQAKIVLALLFKRGGMTIEELEQRTGMGRKSLYRACEGLAAEPYNMLVKQTGRHNRLVWAPSSALLPAIAGHYFAVPDVSQEHIYPELADGEDFQLCRNDTTGNEIEPENAPDVSQGPNWKGSIMMTDELSIHSKDRSSIMNPPRENFPAVESLLEGLDVLFGDVLDISEIPAGTPAKFLLAWIVKTYHDRHKLSNPLGLIRARVMAKTPRSLPSNWQERLPGEYLAAIGVAVPLPETCLGEDEADEAEPEAESEIERIWRLVIAQLELPRSSDRVVREAMPVKWDAQAGVLTVAARDQEAVEWLESRLRISAARMLCGMMNCQADVRFVVGGLAC